MDIKTAKIFFWHAFLVSLLFLIASWLIILIGYDYFKEIAFNMYHIYPRDFNRLYVYSIAFWKILIFQFTLVPAIVLTIIERKKN